MMPDLADDDVRAGLRNRLGRLYADRPVLLGPGVLAAYTDRVEQLRARGCRVLVVATADGAGPLPPAGHCTVVRVELPATVSMTEEVRVLDRFTHDLPADVVAAVETFDPGRVGVWATSPFVSDDEPILGRPVTGGRPAAWLALEDKLLAEDVWDGLGIAHADSRVVETVPAALAAATAELAGPLGAVWSGDARDGLNGGGDFVRWIGPPDGDGAREDRAAAFAFFAPRCDRVRVMPFLDGVPCSIHAMVLPGVGTATFRPVELAVLRAAGARSFVYGGLGTWWDPPAADRAEMREVARRVGDHLGATYGYRGALGVDGVLTADGFRPTEVNPRASAGFTTIATVDPELFGLLQANLVAGVDLGPDGLDLGLDVTSLESVVPLMDATRVGRPVVVGQGRSLGAHTFDVVRDGEELVRSPTPSGSTLVVADTPVGWYARIDPCALLGRGERLAPLNAALVRLLDRELGATLGGLTPAPDLRG